MKRYSSLALLIFILLGSTLTAKVVYVSPTGSNTNPGTIDLPYLTFKYAFSMVSAGDTIFVRGGRYLQAEAVKPSKDGTATAYINLWAYPGENPIIDFTPMSATTTRGFETSRNYWYIRGLEICCAADNGMFISGGFNRVEGCIFHHNKDSGLQISNGGHDNTIINCDSYMNYDPASHGGNADGFSPKLDVGAGNVFKGCRAWYNSDDGFDLYAATSGTVIDSCWAFGNGYNRWNDAAFAGNGSGIKIGGNYTVAPHIVRNCVSFCNAAVGFHQNHNMGGLTVLNCTAYKNPKNFSLGENPTTGQHTIKNNLAVDGSNSIASSSIVAANSWSGFTVTASIFVSIDTTLALQPRDANSRLVPNDFLRLVKGASVIDAGVDVGLPWYGTAPDLGAFETNYPAAVEGEETKPSTWGLSTNYPNPFNPSTSIDFVLPHTMRALLTVHNILGQPVAVLFNGMAAAGVRTTVHFNAANCPSGIYFARLEYTGHTETRRMVLLK